MCGIIGITGTTPALPVLVQGLSLLEYRGYDSAGVALLQEPGTGGPGIWWRRRAGKLRRLMAELGDAPSGPTTGIGHTRWATHGPPTDANAHPQLDCTGGVAVVHNGIIENHLELGDRLSACGHELTSATDTEVLAHLVEDGLGRGYPLPDAVRAALLQVEGAFSLVVLHDGSPGMLVGARRLSPLVFGRSASACVIGSDIVAVMGHAESIYSLDDDQLLVATAGGAEVTTLAGEAVEPVAIEVDWDVERAEKGGFSDFMSKEMHDQPAAVADTLRGRLLPDGRLVLDEARLSDDELRSVDRVLLVACGSSYHAALAAKYAIEHWARLPVEVDVASELRYRDPVLDGSCMVVGVSQSGETIDTLQALREAKRQKAQVMTVSNVVGSSMAREADAVLYTRAGPEVAVAATKTFVAQVVALDVLALYLAELRGTLYPEEAAGLLEELTALPGKLAECLSNERSVALDAVAARLSGTRDFFFIGRHVGYPVALEGALKLKELSYLRAEGYPAGELKHGPIALIVPGTVVVGVATRGPLRSKMMSNVAEVKARGATVVLVANDGDDEAVKAADEVLWVPPTRELFAPVLDVVPLQMLAYRLALRLGNDVDQPRNLAKTVTVE
ncbi:MAG: glutamine--fructose-6-phosphate transaminase (isomerizing) [Acidimicrobiales bacterium]